MIRIAHPTRQPSDAAPVLHVQDLRASYGGIAALQGISLSISRGEIVALLGANGAGKTTTLRCIARLLPIASGQISFQGRDTSRTSAPDLVSAGISLVPEGRAIFPNLTVRENLDLGAYSHRDPRAMRETKDDVVALFPRLGERMTQDAGTLSGGEQQMLAISRALMSRPSLLLLDEPSLGIAPKLVAQIAGAIRAIAAAGMTILLVEQNTRLALSLSTRAYVLQSGTIAVSGPSASLATDPSIRAAYLGG